MPKFPEPPSPAFVREISPDFVPVSADTALARIFFRGGDHPTEWNSFRFWGPAQSRFDHHLPDKNGKPSIGERGVFYAADAGTPGALAVCLAEVFQETRIVDSRDRAPWLVVFRTARTLQLLDLRGLWPTRVGASSAIASGSKARARRWSRAIYETYPDIDGLIYPSSMGGNADACALLERAQTALPSTPDFHRALADPAMDGPLLAATAAINFGLL
ncbi:RES family NAD+ phosphorylase [Pseudochelatococcus sp. B33]